MIDLRLDTVTRPTAGMRRAMAEAEVENAFPFGARSPDDAQVVNQSHGPGSMVDRGTTITLRAF